MKLLGWPVLSVPGIEADDAIGTLCKVAARAGYALEGTPQDTNLKWEENAAYQSRAKVDGNSIIGAHILARGFTLLDPKDYVQLHDFYQKVISADQQPLVLTAAQASKVQ